jgi:hypothetical protein
MHLGREGPGCQAVQMTEGRFWFRVLVLRNGAWIGQRRHRLISVSSRKHISAEGSAMRRGLTVLLLIQEALKGMQQKGGSSLLGARGLRIKRPEHEIDSTAPVGPAPRGPQKGPVRG